MDSSLIILRSQNYIYELLLLNGAYIGRTLVPQCMWQEVMGYNPSQYFGNMLPVDSVSFNDIQLFLARLQETSRVEFQLLDEDLWKATSNLRILESSYNGGVLQYGPAINLTLNKDLLYDDPLIGDIPVIMVGRRLLSPRLTMPYRIWSSENSDMQPHEITTSTPNSNGLYDMRGNVWDICQKMEEYVDDSNELVLPRRENETDIEYKRRILKAKLLKQHKVYIGPRKRRVQSVILKGGAWNVSEESCMSDYSIELGNDERYANAGFRIVYNPYK